MKPLTCTTGSFPKTSALYIFARPSLTRCHDGRSLMSFSKGECSANEPPVFTCEMKVQVKQAGVAPASSLLWVFQSFCRRIGRQ